MVTVEPEVLDELRKPLDPARVKMVSARGGQKQPYLEQWDVKQRANQIFGHDGWAPRVLELRCIGEQAIERDGRAGWHVGYVAIVQVEIDGFPARSDVGYGDAVEYGQTPITCHELASKEAVSDGMKRAMTSLGDQFGNSLYDKAGAFHGGRQPTRPDTTAVEAVVTYGEGLQLPAGWLERIVRLVALDKTAQVGSIQRKDVPSLKLAIDFATSNPDEAEKQLRAFEGTNASG